MKSSCTAPVIGLMMLSALVTTHAALPGGWHHYPHFPTGADLQAVWAQAPDNVFVGGTNGEILRWDGTAWQAFPTPDQLKVQAIDGVAANDAWAVGGDEFSDDPALRSLVWHFDGSAWSAVNPPELFPGQTLAFQDVVAIATDDVWALSTPGPQIAHWDGLDWRFVTLPPGIEGLLNDLAAAPDGSLFAVGTHGQILRYASGAWAIERKTETGPVSADLVLSVWAGENIAVAGTNARALLVRNATGDWTPATSNDPCAARSLWGRADNEIYAFSDRCLLQFDGATITRSDIYNDVIRGIWSRGTGAGDRLFAVGPEAVGHEIALTGIDAFTPLPLVIGENLQTRFRMTGIRSAGNEGLFLFGSAQLFPDGDPLQVLSELGATPFLPRPPGMPRDSEVFDVLALAPNDIYAAWDSIDAPFVVGLFHWDGSAWSHVTNEFGNPLASIRHLWQSPDGTVYGLGTGELFRIPALDQALRLVSMPQPGFSAFGGVSETEIYLGAFNGNIYRFDGTLLNQETTPGGTVIRGIATDGSNVYAVGEDGNAWHRGTGGVWAQLSGVEASPGEDFDGIVAGNDGVLAAQGRTIWHFDGATATRELLGIPGIRAFIADMPDGTVRAVSQFLVGGSHNGPWWLGNRPREDMPQLVRLDPASTDWQPIGGTGLYLRPTAPTSAPVLVIPRIREELERWIPDPVGNNGFLTTGRDWVIRAGGPPLAPPLPPVDIGLFPDPTDDPPIDINSSEILVNETDPENPEGYSTAASTLLDLPGLLGRSTTVPTNQFSLWTLGEPQTANPLVPIFADGFEDP